MASSLFFLLVACALPMHISEHAELVSEAMANDDECHSASCSLHALQRHGKQLVAGENIGSGITVHPALCDSSIVADSCVAVNKLTKEYWHTAEDDSLDSVAAAELAEQLMVSRRSILSFLGGELSAKNLETDPTAIKLQAFQVSCQELCKKTVSFLPSSHVPPTSDLACYVPSGSSVPECTVDVSPQALGDIVFSDDFHSNSSVPKASTLAEAPYEDEPAEAESLGSGPISNNNSASEELKQLVHHPDEAITKEELRVLDALNYPDKSPESLAISIANLFRIYPLTAIKALDSKSVKKAGSALEIWSKQSTETQRASWKNDVMKVAVTAQAYTATALRSMNSKKANDIMLRWFGKDDMASKKEVRRVVNAVHELLSNVDYVYPGDKCRPNVYAYVYPNPPKNQNSQGQYIFHLCETYMKVDRAEQIETLTHEGSHHQMSLTDDVCYKGEGPDCRKAYGRVACQGLAASKPEKALRNADSFCYFINDIQPGAKGPKCPSRPKCSMDSSCSCSAGMEQTSVKMAGGGTCFTCDKVSAASPRRRSVHSSPSTGTSEMCQQTDTGGTCRLFWCSHSRGPTDCRNGHCYCKEGLCSVDGACTYPSIAGSEPQCKTKDTGGKCAWFGCYRGRGPTSCVNGKCVCKPGFCSIKGFCTYPQ